METWKEKIANAFTKFLEWIGIEPIYGFALIMIPFAVWHFRDINNREVTNWQDIIYDVAIVLAIIGVLVGAGLKLFS